MRRSVYLAGFFLVGVSVLLQVTLALVVQISPYASFDNVYAAIHRISLLADLFGHPVPPIIRLLLPRLLYLVILGGAVFLVLRRIWQFLRSRSFSPPSSFTRTPYAIFGVSIVSALLFFLVLILAQVLNSRLLAIGNIIVLPAVFLLPITVFYVELASFKLGAARGA